MGKTNNFREIDLSIKKNSWNQFTSNSKFVIWKVFLKDQEEMKTNQKIEGWID